MGEGSIETPDVEKVYRSVGGWTEGTRVEWDVMEELCHQFYIKISI